MEDSSICIPAELSSIYQVVWTNREIYEAEVHACLFTTVELSSNEQSFNFVLHYLSIYKPCIIPSFSDLQLKKTFGSKRSVLSELFIMLLLLIM